MRGLTVFVTALVTIALWVPLRNRPERLPDGSVMTETYFGAFTYLTLRTELKEPEYKMSWTPSYQRLGLTAIATGALWAGVILLIKRKKAESGTDGTEA